MVGVVPVMSKGKSSGRTQDRVTRVKWEASPVPGGHPPVVVLQDPMDTLHVALNYLTSQGVRRAEGSGGVRRVP